MGASRMTHFYQQHPVWFWILVVWAGCALATGLICWTATRAADAIATYEHDRLGWRG